MKFSLAKGQHQTIVKCLHGALKSLVKDGVHWTTAKVPGVVFGQGENHQATTVGVSGMRKIWYYFY